SCSASSSCTSSPPAPARGASTPRAGRLAETATLALERPASVCHKACRRRIGRAAGSQRGETMKTFFVQFKCELGKAYEVAGALADAEIASEIYSTAGNFDLMAKFYIGDDEDV